MNIRKKFLIFFPHNIYKLQVKLNILSEEKPTLTVSFNSLFHPDLGNILDNPILKQDAVCHHIPSPSMLLNMGSSQSNFKSRA